jgi:CRISPR-associated protein Csy1
MDMSGEPAGELTQQVREVIEAFLQERLKPKLDDFKRKEEKANGDPKKLQWLREQREQLQSKYQIENWVCDAARRVFQIQQVTHALKFTHPDAKGTNLFAPGNSAVGQLLVGTHIVDSDLHPDVVGNAAALDVNKFLNLKVGGKTLLQLAIEGDVGMCAALSHDAQKAKSWMKFFAELTSEKGEPSSHKLAKQVYWPVGDGEYHILAPLFPTSLVGAVWNSIRHDRYSETAKLARAAHREGAHHDRGYCEYPNLAIQKFGGTKPQNISQLNSERYGENYLLPSLPPSWSTNQIRPPLKTSSIFGHYLKRRKSVRDLIHILPEFLLRVQDVNNIRVRKKRSELVGYLLDELLQFAAELHELPGGWSSAIDCRLNIDEQCWLDPWRAEADEAFAKKRAERDWKKAICKRFGNWLNTQLSAGRRSLPMGEDEAREWVRALDQELRLMRMEID